MHGWALGRAERGGQLPTHPRGPTAARRGRERCERPGALREARPGAAVAATCAGRPAAPRLPRVGGRAPCHRPPGSAQPPPGAGGEGVRGAREGLLEPGSSVRAAVLGCARCAGGRGGSQPTVKGAGARHSPARGAPEAQPGGWCPRAAALPSTLAAWSRTAW